MSVAFTREEDIEAAAANIPDRPISPHPNLVTAEGLAQLEEAYAAAKAAYGAAQAAGDVSTNRTAMARATRDLRYFGARRASAQLVTPSGDNERITFGSTVTMERENGIAQTYRIVGEDEADPKLGSVSYVSPLARSLLGKQVGETVQVAGREVEVLEIR